jgi:D-alanine-D-alanine ligase
MSERLRVAVVMGGRSSEREISLETGRNVYNSLDRSRFDVVPFYMDGRGRLWQIGLALVVQNTTRDLESRLESDARRVAYDELRDLVDFVYIGLHGKYGEDGCFQGLLELLDVPYSGSGVLGSALGMDKRVQRHLLRQAGIDVPRTVAVDRGAWEADQRGATDAVVASPGLPCVVKPSREGCSTALAVVRTSEDLVAAIGNALQWDNTVLVEEFLEGTEVTVAVLGVDEPHAFPATETPPRGAFLTVEEKFLPGEGVNVTPARLAPDVHARVREVAEQAFRALHLTAFARMDMFVTTDGRIVLGEPNTLPGSSPSSTIFLGPMEEGIGPRELLSLVIDLSLEAHAGKRGPLG